MTKQTRFTFAAIAPASRGTVVLLAEEGGKLSPAGKALDKALSNTLTKAIKLRKFNGKHGSVIDVLVPANGSLSRVLIVGAGKKKALNLNDWAYLGASIRARLSGKDEPVTVVLEGALKPQDVFGEEAAQAALGMILRSYKFDKYKTRGAKSGKKSDADNKDLSKISIQCAEPAAARRAFAASQAVGEGVNLARDLVNEPANILGPKEFAQRSRALSKLGVKVTLLDEKKLSALGMESLLAVGQGSERASYVSVMEWQGGKKDDAPVAIVGKGVTFDTGGISLKPGAGMGDMKGDMAGAACVVGLMHALAARKAKVNAVGLIGLVENMPSGTATRPGDIIGSMSGQTIEVLNTDAEGRLVLADVLWHAQTKYKPKWVVNLATLTGAILVALGKEHAGMFSNNDALCKKLSAAGEAVNEKVWRLPLGPKYDELIKSDVADMKNIGGRWGGSITAAQFLQRFIKDDTPWAHLDIAGTGMAAPKTDVNQSWGSGYGVRLLNEMIARHEEA